MPFGNSAARRSLGWFPYMIYCIFIFIKATEHSLYLTQNKLVTWQQGLSRAQGLWATFTGAAHQWGFTQDKALHTPNPRVLRCKHLLLCTNTIKITLQVFCAVWP